jgi:hypothetical protein
MFAGDVVPLQQLLTLRRDDPPNDGNAPPKRPPAIEARTETTLRRAYRDRVGLVPLARNLFAQCAGRR